MWLMVRAVLWAAVLPGLTVCFVPWRFFGVASAALDMTHPAHLAGLTFVAAGASLLAACIWEFAQRGRGTLSPLDPPRRLVISGLYRFVRNPMYVSVTAVVIGQAALFGDWRLLVYGAVFWLACHLFVMGYEEPTLARTFGDEYERFRANVPRWIPRLTPWHASRTDASTR